MSSDKKEICPNCFVQEYQNGECPVCGYQEKFSLRSRRALPEGIILDNRFIVGKVLGEGGFGITYKACDTQAGGICAIKEYAPVGIACRAEDGVFMRADSEDNAERYHDGLGRFLEEAQILSRLGQIPSVVNVTSCFTENETAYFSMEFLDGANLRQVVRASKNRLPVSEITNVILQVATAMDIIHKKANILHRDISPENIYITKDRQVKIIDFGSAKQNISEYGTEFSVVLKLKYAPPEQFSSKMKQGTYTDVYSLASTYYYALTGITLPTAMDRLGGIPYVPLKQMGIGVSDSVSDAVDRALELKCQDRTQTMQEFIEGIAGTRFPTPPAETKLQVAERKLPYVEEAGKERGRMWIIPVNEEIRIGRSKTECHILLTGHPEVSKVHCIMLYEESKGVFYIRDMSRNGTFVDGYRLQKDKTYRIKAGSRIALATPACVIRVGVRHESG